MAKRITTAGFRALKQNREKITMLTAYDYPTAKIVDSCGVDAILVGDSLGMVVLGYEDTTQVTMEDMLHHSKAVSRAAQHALVVTDMPFLSYHLGIAQSVMNAGRLVQEGHAQAVKLEGGKDVAQDVKAIIKAGIPVMGHIGLTPQSIHNLGGYFIQGKTESQAKKLIEDAKALEDAGAFSIVLECVPLELAELISSNLSIPTIGIGSGYGCDGQVLVIHDLLGLYAKKSPSFVKRYGDLGKDMEKSVLSYIEEVKNGDFPSLEHSYPVNPETYKNLMPGLEVHKIENLY